MLLKLGAREAQGLEDGAGVLPEGQARVLGQGPRAAHQNHRARQKEARRQRVRIYAYLRISCR